MLVRKAVYLVISSTATALSHLFLSSACTLLAAAAVLAAPPAAAQPAQSSVLQQRYRAAQDFQAAQQLDKAAGQYRIFLADALGELARLDVQSGAHAQAANEFQEALTLVPEFPALRLEYARLALNDKDLDRAEREAATVIRQAASKPKLAASAHALLGRVLPAKGDNPGGIRELEQAVALDPTFENGYALATADLDSGNGDAATKIFAEMLASFGDTAQIHMLFGQAYGNSDFQSRSVDEFRAAIARDPKLPGAHYSLAAALLVTSGDTKTAEAEAELRKEIALASPKDPSAGAAYAALGHLIASQKPEEALTDLRRATELDPSNPDAWFYLAQVFADAHQPDQAIPALRRSIALTADPAHNGYQVRKAHYLLGRLLTQTGHPDQAREEVAASQALMEQNISRDRSRLADYLNEARPSASDTAPPGQASTAAIAGQAASAPAAVDPEASRAAQSLRTELTPVIADSYNNLGAIAGSENNPPIALHYFERAVEWNPSLPGLDLNWGRAAFLAGDPAEAIGPLTRALHTQPNDSALQSMLGLAQFLVRDYAAARTTLAPLADTADAQPELRFAYAKSLLMTGDLPGATQRLEALAKATPENGEVHAALGEAYVRAHSPAAAGEFEAAIRLNPRDPEPHAELARLRLAEGNTRAAVSELEIAVQLAPNDADLRRELDASRARISQP